MKSLSLTQRRRGCSHVSSHFGFITLLPPLTPPLYLFLLLPLFSEVSPLVEIRELFFSQPALFCFS